MAGDPKQRSERARTRTAGSVLRFVVACALLCVTSEGQAAPVVGDAAQELLLSAPPLLPQLGPRFAGVTVDVSGVLGGSCPAGLVRNLVRRLPQLHDVRLRFFPLRAGGERGAELLWSACEERPDQCFALLIELCDHPEWLSPSAAAVLTSSASAEPTEELWRAVERIGFDSSSLREALRTHRARPRLLFLWASVRSPRSVPDVLVNGRRVSGAQLDSRVMDEIDLQRLRAQQALRGGVPLSRLYEQLHDQALSDENRRPDSLWGPDTAALSRDLRPYPMRVDVDGLPCQGPQIAPTTLVYVLNHESFQAGAQTRSLLDAVARYRDRVRLCVLHAPITPAARRTTELIAQIAAVDSQLYFRVLDELSDVMSRRYFLRYDDVASLLRRRGELSKVEAATARGKNRVIADLDQLQRLGLRPAGQLLIDGKVLASWTTDSLSAELAQRSRQGLLLRLKKNLGSPP